MCGMGRYGQAAHVPTPSPLAFRKRSKVDFVSLSLAQCKTKGNGLCIFYNCIATTHDYSRKKHVGSLWFRSLRQSVFRGIQTFLFLRPEPMHSVRLQTLTLSVQADRVDCYCSQNLLSHVLLEFPM